MPDSRGFTLVELLVATALTLSLAAGVLSTWAALQQSLSIAADRAALSERVLLGLDVVTGAAEDRRETMIGTNPMSAPPMAPNPCVLPIAPGGWGNVRLLLVRPGEIPCFPAADMPADAPLLMVDTLIECTPECPTPDAAGFLLLEPGCHPLLTRSTPELRLAARQQRPADCALGTRVAVLERRLFYFREYAWQRGDGLGALMVRQLNPDASLDWGRSEMLIAGVDDWIVTPRWSAASCEPTGACPISGWADGIAVTLAMRGWVRDTTSIDAISRRSMTRTVAGLTALGGDSR